jgi:SAM-dependent methyltransferase
MAREIHNILVNTIMDRALASAARTHLHGRLIDIGCGVKPYSTMLAPYVDEHIGVDHEATPHDKANIDLLGTAYDIPVEDASFDCAICTAVLEHLAEPEQAIRECFRVLCPGGAAIYTVPFIWHLHEEPHDYYRVSSYGLRYLFEKAGFQVVEIKALSGFWVTAGQLLVYNLYRMNRGPLRWLRIVDLAGLFIQLLAYLLDKLDKTEQWTWMNLIVARKPAGAQP